MTRSVEVRKCTCDVRAGKHANTCALYQPRGHTESERMTQREERIRGLALNGRKTLIDAYHDPHFCVGASWATLSLILGELGEAYEVPPWNKDPLSDSQETP